MVHIGETPFQAPGIPEGFDALVRSDEDCIDVLIRTAGDETSRERLDHAMSGGELLDALGRRGLTSICIPADDPLAQKLP
ncbi:hypothetical protein [uncultured Roseibium sp.]|uniref:hypothetical protein n=1 Tax=uncultured Roseibium sp. TaxID=1936171 RepID=UPI003217AF0B